VRRLENAYRDHAWLSRELARQLTDSESKAHLFEMAEIYDTLAAAAEEPKADKQCGGRILIGTLDATV